MHREIARRGEDVSAFLQGSFSWIPLTVEERNEKRFRRLHAEWRRETSHLSKLSDILMHPAYQQIIGMGSDALPLIMADLRKDAPPDLWFWALRSITGECIVPEGERVTVDQMASAWIEWGREHGYA